MAAQTEWLEKDFYEILGVPETASEDQIAKAYRRLARRWHPDANPDKPDAEERFKDISAAYEVLGDPAKRVEYDQLRRLGPRADGSSESSGFRVHVGNAGDLGDLGDFDGLLGGLFGRSGGGRGRRPGRSRARRGGDLETAVEVSFEQAVRGATISVPVTAEAACEVCGGSGDAPDSKQRTCGACNGSGAVQVSQGPFSVTQTCRACGGAGVTADQPCPACTGVGRVRRTRQVRARIPAGVDDGHRIRVPGRGSPGSGGGPAGDLYVTIRVAPHPVFGRSGRNLTLTVPLSFAEAALGTEVKVPTLDGEAVTVRVPAGTQPGQVLRIRGRGVPDGGRQPAGDLLVTVQVVVPAPLTAKARKAVETLANLCPPPARDHLGV